MKTVHDFPLATLTSFGTGGPAEILIMVEETAELYNVLKDYKKPLWLIGSGANSLISDDGLPGSTLQLRNTKIEINGDNELLLIADAGVAWDDLVKYAIDNDFWGVELTSGIPGSVGAAVVGNIAAYGQSVAQTLKWVEVVDTKNDPSTTECLRTEELGLKYRYSDFQNDKFGHYVIVRAAFELSKSPTTELSYASAVKVSEELDIASNTLKGRQTIIMEARKQAGSLLNHTSEDHNKTAGSFFRNPELARDIVEKIISFEEHNVAANEILKQNLLHSGDSFRVSAAHVLLAAGFKRGQTWGPVRLHPDHILKIENTGDATSQQIYDVAQEIITTVKQKLGITLEPEVRFIGKFN
jgi:UDP-N-acetylmuramate dehydrogenase